MPSHHAVPQRQVFRIKAAEPCSASRSRRLERHRSTPLRVAARRESGNAPGAAVLDTDASLYALPMRGAVAAGNPHTAEAGAWALASGGNAVDAVVAAAFAGSSPKGR